MAWLGRGDDERLRGILDDLRRDIRTSADRFFEYGGLPDERMRCFTSMPRVDGRAGLVDLRQDLVRVLLEGAQEGPVAFIHFLRFYAEEENPLLERQRAGQRIWLSRWYRGETLSDEDLVRLWLDVLERFVIDRLVPLGCLEMGAAEDEAATIQLTDAGRYLLGASDDFTYATAQSQDVVVQPNFEVVFLGPNPRAEAFLGQVAERIGQGVGTLFRITRGSVQGAFLGGLEGQRIVDDLTEVSSKPVPPNVEQQILDWTGQCRRVEVSSAVLIECPDAETALRILSMAGEKARRLSETVVALPDRKGLKALQSKLRRAGISTG
jgi:hypothetical protein